MTRFNDIVKMRQLKTMAKDYFFIFCGIALYAIGYNAFILPEKLVQGGVTGISSLLYYAWEWSPAICIWVINVSLLLIAYRALSKVFVLRTIIGVTMLSGLIALFQSIFQAFPIITPGEDKFMHVLIGAMMGGAGLALVFAHDGSTGGTDIIVALINKYSRMSLGRAMQLVDICIIASSYFLFHSFEVIVYGVVFTLIASFTMDYVINGSRQTVQFMIISKRYEEIADAVNKQLDRGVTIMHGQGWYSKKDVEVVMVLCRRYESQGLFNLIKALDPNAIVSQSFCHGVFGEGFDKIK